MSARAAVAGAVIAAVSAVSAVVRFNASKELTNAQRDMLLLTRGSPRTGTPPSGTERVSAKAAVASAVIAAVSAFAATILAIYGVSASRNLAATQQVAAARTEISQYVVQMSQLDRTGGSASRNEIVTLASQVDSLVNQYGQKKLNVSASTYRLIGLFLTLSTTDLELAERMAQRALRLATRRAPDGASGLRMEDPLEALQAYRVLADVAAQNLDFPTMTKEYQAALDISEKEGKRNRYIRIEAHHFTRVYWTLDAMMLFDDLGEPTAEQCNEVRHLADEARQDFAALGKAYSLDGLERLSQPVPQAHASACKPQLCHLPWPQSHPVPPMSQARNYQAEGREFLYQRMRPEEFLPSTPAGPVSELLCGTARTLPLAGGPAMPTIRMRPAQPTSRE
ncbi:hypothetical protein [Streptomyces sp. NPDC058086]|uniref:hypothetical protein n=1 Tax=Streptomyces sp. NPDC058086 TaxID=3346334 RepID=UPI0036EE6EF9